MKINYIKKSRALAILIVSLCTVMVSSVYAQLGEASSRELYQDYISNVKKSNVATGYLLNRGFINDDEIESLYQFIEGYDEENEEIVPPISNLNAVSWSQLYELILQSEFRSQNRLPSLEEITNTIDQTSFESRNIPLLIFDVKGELLSDIEVEKSINGDVKAEPYNMVHMFGASSYMSTFYKKNISFDLKSANYFSGFDNKPNKIYIDFSDGRGIQSYTLNNSTTISISYADFGEKIVRVYRDADLNGNNLKIGSSFVIDIKADNVKNPSTIIEDLGNASAANKSAKGLDDTPITTSGGKAYCFNGSGNGNVLDKPVIIVQGFDPVGDITINSQRDKYRVFQEQLNTDLDLVFVMFNNTNLSLQSNTNVLKNLVRKINTQKQGNFETIVIGESMGGLISRMALKQLENENYDHNVGLYVSFDAPHQGANIPPGIQHLFKDVLDSRLVRGSSAILGLIDRTAINLTNILISPFTGNKLPELREVLQINKAYRALNALNSTAAKSMLVRHVSQDGSFDASQNTLTSLGYPEKARNIALINGSNESRDLQQRFSGGNIVPGERLVRVPLWRTDCNEFSLNAWTSTVNSRAKVSQIKWKVGLKVPEIIIKWKNKCITPKIFGKCIKTKIPVKVKVGLQCATTNLVNKERYYTFNGASYDDAPGSTLPGLDDAGIDIASNISFVPTASAIDLSSAAYNSATDPNGLRAVTSSTKLDEFIQNDLTPFDEVYSKGRNSNHVLFNDFGDTSNFRAIINNEFMSDNLNLQNRTVQFDRDFQASQKIVIGTNVDMTTDKIVETGDVIVMDNAKVSFDAGTEIVLSQGVTIKEGAQVDFSISPSVAAKSLDNSPEDYFQISIIGDKTYQYGEEPAFKVLVSNPAADYDFEWEIVSKPETNSFGEEFLIGNALYPGVYMAKVRVISKKSGVTRSLTKSFKIKNNLEELSQTTTLDGTRASDKMMLYPNPTEGRTTLITSKEGKKILVYDLQGKVVLETTPTSKTWTSLDLSTSESGTYIVKVIFEDASISESTIIKK